MLISDWSSDVCSSDLSSVVRSAVTVSTCAPCCRNSCAAASISGSLAAMIRSYPSPAQHFASSRPIPVDAPVTIASGRSAMKNLLSCGGQNHLGPFILIFLEVFVASRRFFTGKAVAVEAFSVDLTLSDTVQNIVALGLHMRLYALP